jgi:hypothetical protein
LRVLVASSLAEPDCWRLFGCGSAGALGDSCGRTFRSPLEPVSSLFGVFAGFVGVFVGFLGDSFPRADMPLGGFSSLFPSAGSWHPLAAIAATRITMHAAEIQGYVAADCGKLLLYDMKSPVRPWGTESWKMQRQSASLFISLRTTR